MQFTARVHRSVPNATYCTGTRFHCGYAVLCNLGWTKEKLPYKWTATLCTHTPLYVIRTQKSSYTYSSPQYFFYIFDVFSNKQCTYTYTMMKKIILKYNFFFKFTHELLFSWNQMLAVATLGLVSPSAVPLSVTLCGPSPLPNHTESLQILRQTWRSWEMREFRSLFFLRAFFLFGTRSETSTITLAGRMVVIAKKTCFFRTVARHALCDAAHNHFSERSGWNQKCD